MAKLNGDEDHKREGKQNRKKSRKVLCSNCFTIGFKESKAKYFLDDAFLVWFVQERCCTIPINQFILKKKALALQWNNCEGINIHTNVGECVCVF